MIVEEIEYIEATVCGFCGSDEEFVVNDYGYDFCPQCGGA